MTRPTMNATGKCPRFCFPSTGRMPVGTAPTMALMVCLGSLAGATLVPGCEVVTVKKFDAHVAEFNGVREDREERLKTLETNLKQLERHSKDERKQIQKSLSDESRALAAAVEAQSKRLTSLNDRLDTVEKEDISQIRTGLTNLTQRHAEIQEAFDGLDQKLTKDFERLRKVVGDFTDGFTLQMDGLQGQFRQLQDRLVEHYIGLSDNLKQRSKMIQGQSEKFAELTKRFAETTSELADLSKGMSDRASDMIDLMADVTDDFAKKIKEGTSGEPKAP